MSSGGAAKQSQPPQVSIPQLGVPVAEQSQPQVSIPQLGASVAEQSQPQSSIAQLGVSVAEQSQPQISIPQLGVSVAFLLDFTEKHQKSGKLLPTDSSKDVVENIIKSETAGAKCSFVDHLAASKDELESKAVQKATHFLSHAWSYLLIDDNCICRRCLLFHVTISSYRTAMPFTLLDTQ
eukprot:g41166.t1